MKDYIINVDITFNGNVQVQVPGTLPLDKARRVAEIWAACMSQVTISDQDAPVEDAQDNAEVDDKTWDSIKLIQGPGGVFTIEDTEVVFRVENTGEHFPKEVVTSKCVVAHTDPEGNATLTYINVICTQNQFDDGEHIRVCKDYVDCSDAVVFDHADELSGFDSEYSEEIWEKAETINLLPEHTKEPDSSS